MAKKKEKTEQNEEILEEISEMVEEIEETASAEDILIEGEADGLAELMRLQDQYLRTLAEYDNYRKRTEKERERIYGAAVNDTLKIMIEALDDLEHGILSISDEGAKAGVSLIYKNLLARLEALGVSEIGTQGEIFDPLIHNAVMHTDDPSFEDNTVAEVLAKGYKRGDDVLRYAMVKVAN